MTDPVRTAAAELVEAIAEHGAENGEVWRAYLALRAALSAPSPRVPVLKIAGSGEIIGVRAPTATVGQRVRITVSEEE